MQGGVPPLGIVEKEELLGKIQKEWSLTHDNSRLHRDMKFKDFKTPLAILNSIGQMAEEQGHHPDMKIGYGHLEIEVWTHKINDLVESDFIFASKVDEIIRLKNDESSK